MSHPLTSADVLTMTEAEDIFRAHGLVIVEYPGTDDTVSVYVQRPGFMQPEHHAFDYEPSHRPCVRGSYVRSTLTDMEV